MQKGGEIKKAVDWHILTKEEVFRELKTSEKGLTEEEATKRLKKYGKNVIKRTNRLRPLKILLSQFHSFLIYMLIIAAVISFLIGHSLDGTVISAIIVLNAGIGFFQQYRAERAVLNLRKLLVPKSKIYRSGKLIEVSASDIVPGDVVELGAGDKVNADSRIINSERLQTNEAILTGESLPIAKSTKKISKQTSLAEQENRIFAGTQIVSGSALAVIVSTGMNTVFGTIAQDLQEIEVQETPMQKRLNNFSKQIGIIILLLVVIVAGLGWLTHLDAVEMFLTVVALAVAAIPEGLPAVLTVSFAISSMMMSKQNVIIRRLPAVESLGSVTVICSDKTGTITEEKMSIQEIFQGDKFYFKKGKKLFIKDKEVDFKNSKGLFQLLRTSILCNNARFEKSSKNSVDYDIIGDPTEKALVSMSLDLGLDKKILTEKEPRIREFEFTSKRKMMSMVRDSGRNKIMYSKGALEEILKISNFEYTESEIKKLTEKRKIEILNKSKSMEENALRVLGIAYKNVSSKSKIEEKGLIFLGFVGMIDPPRPEVKSAIKQCRDAGINIKIITGDSATTANAIAREIGIKGKTIIEQDLKKMSDTALLNSIDEISIFARTTPHQKLRITKTLQQKNEVVAITGDGINDVLALKASDVGIAMGLRGTDVARDVSDIVLTDDNFASIVQGVKEGRKTYDNVKKFTKFFLAVNFSEIFLILTALILRLPLPLLPLQILWINLITDSLPALALAFEKQENVMSSKPRVERSILDGIWLHVLIAGIITLVAKFSVYFFGLNQGVGIDLVRTQVLTAGILFELFFVFAIRTNKSVFKIGLFSNKWLNYAVTASLGLHLVLLYTSLGFAFKVVPLTLNQWIFLLPFALSGFILFEIWKFIERE